MGDNASYRSIPGHPRWGLAPIEMAWEGKSPGEICAQLKDRNRNGGRDLVLLHEHLAKDDLIAWGWNPGLGRQPVPGTQARLGELIQAWIDTRGKQAGALFLTVDKFGRIGRRRLRGAAIGFPVFSKTGGAGGTVDIAGAGGCS